MENKVVDAYLRYLNGPLMISWDVTNRCNMRCIHCLNCSGDVDKHNYKQELNEEETCSLLKQIVEIHPQSVCICGGEPTLRSDLEYIVRELSSVGIAVNMVSNGLLMTREKLQALKTAGLEFLQISLDSLKPETHDFFRSCKGAYKCSLGAICNAIDLGIRIAVSFCPNKLNLHEFEAYVDEMYRIGVRHIRMMPFLPMGRGLVNARDIMPSALEYFDFKLSLLKMRKKYKDMLIEWGDPLEHIYLAIFLPRPEPIVMEIRANGDIAPSVYLPISVGNCKKHTLKEYWEAGFNKIWAQKEVVELAKSVLTLDSFFEISLNTWNIRRKEIDLIDF